MTVSLDVTSEQATDTAVELVKRHVSSLDIFINNAGYSQELNYVGDLDRREWWRTREVGVKGIYLVALAFMDLALVGSSRTIIDLSSKGGL